MRSVISGLLVVLVGLCWSSGLLASQHETLVQDVIEVRTQNDVAYVSGGVGDREQKTIRKIAGDFSLMMTFALEKGNYVGTGHVAVRDAQGNTVVETDTKGPLFAADLPPGTYEVKATEFMGQARMRTVEILPDERRVLHFTWEKKN